MLSLGCKTYRRKIDYNMACAAVIVKFMTVQFRSTTELEAHVGQQVRAARLAADIDQVSLAARANVAVGSLKNLEAGRGSTLRTLVRIVRALDLEDWLDSLYEVSPESPLALAR